MISTVQSKLIEEAIIKYYGIENMSTEKLKRRLNVLKKKIERCAPYVDNNFIKKLNPEFSSRLTELYFLDSLMNNSLKISHQNDAGMDIWIDDINGWGEFVAATNGSEGKKHSLKPLCNGEVTDSDLNDDLLIGRVISVISTKIKKINADVKKGLIKCNQPVVLFVSTAFLYELVPISLKEDLNGFLRAVLPISTPFFMLRPEGKSGIERDSKLGIIKPKESGVINIDNDIFLKEESKFVSAVVFSYQCIFKQRKRFQNGNDFIVVHNPCAKNPIKYRLFKNDKEYKTKLTNEGFKIRAING